MVLRHMLSGLILLPLCARAEQLSAAMRLCPTMGHVPTKFFCKYKMIMVVIYHVEINNTTCTLNGVTID